MATKLAKNSYPSGHSAQDFKCFGPPATKDGEFENNKICDLGCFKQDGIDTNKYYMGCIAQSSINNKYYVYFEWGKTGQSKPAFQMYECSSEQDAQAVYAKQLHAKNDKRGQWVDHPVLGKILQAKPNKDCYLVRPQTSRSTGLPDARNIVLNKIKKPVHTEGGNKSYNLDEQTLKLLKDLDAGTTTYTRKSMVGNALPTQAAIDEARQICDEATKIVNSQANLQENKELVELTNLLYSRIPKVKKKNDDWLLSPANIQTWLDDLNAYESSLHSDIDYVESNPLSEFNLRKFKFVPRQSEKGGYIYDWVKRATRNRHDYLRGEIKIKNLWYLERDGDVDKLDRAQSSVIKDGVIRDHVPLHQIKHEDRQDPINVEKYDKSNTFMLFHGTRSVNISGILRKSFILPKQLVGVSTTGALLGHGIYLASDWKKSAGYTSLRNSYWGGGSGGIVGREAFMFVCDSVMGNIYLSKQVKGYNGPPNGYHSVFGKAGVTGYLKNDEYVIYNTDQIRIRYLVEFLI